MATRDLFENPTLQPSAPWMIRSERGGNGEKERKVREDGGAMG